MLAKKYRLPVGLILSKKGIVRQGRYFLVKIYPTAYTYSRVSVVVPNRVAALATQRNTIKRRAYTAISSLLPTLRAQDYLITALPAAYPAPLPDAIMKELKELLFK